MLRQKSTFYLFFFLSVLSTIITPALIFSWRVNLLIPILVWSFYLFPKGESLYIAVSCGLLSDLMSSHEPLGIFALSYCLSHFFLYQKKQQFFEDSLSTLPIMSFIYSSISTCLQFLLLKLFAHTPSASWAWAFTDLLLMPALDAFFAALFFSFPLHFFFSGSKAKDEQYVLRRPQ